MPRGEISNCAVYALPMTLECPESEIQAPLYFTFKTTAENNFQFLHFGWLGLVDNDNEKLLRPTGERASLKNVSLIPLASTGLKISDQLAAWTG